MPSNRGDLTLLIRTDVRDLLTCVDATDSEEAVRMQLDIQVKTPYLATASTRQLEDIVVEAARLDNELWSVPFFTDLQAAAESIRNERQQQKVLRKAGMRQKKMF